MNLVRPLAVASDCEKFYDQDTLRNYYYYYCHNKTIFKPFYAIPVLFI